MDYGSLVEPAYTAIIVLSSLAIAWRVHRPASLTGHVGIRMFRESFLLFAAAFAVRYALLSVAALLPDPAYAAFATIGLSFLFTYLLASAGFSLVYSLVWKGMEGRQVLLLQAAALATAVLSVLYTPLVLYATQLAAFAYGASVLYLHYRAHQKKGHFLQLYFFSLVLAFLGYAVNTAAFLFGAAFPLIGLYARVITAAAFLFILYTVFRVLAWRRSANA